jgi:hypothetical protein
MTELPITADAKLDAKPAVPALALVPTPTFTAADPVEPDPAAEEPAHPSLRTLCEVRQGELKDVLARLGPAGSPQTRKDIEAALDALDGLLTGNLDAIPPVVAMQLSRWIASSKYLGVKETRELAEQREVVQGPHQLS